MLSCEPPAVIVQQSTNNQNTSGGTTWIHPMTKQESVTSFLSNNSEGFHSASPSSSSRDSNPHSPGARSVDSNREGSPTFYDNRIQPSYSTPYHHQAINMGFNPLTTPAAELQRSSMPSIIHSTPMVAPKSPQETGEADFEHYYDSNAKNEKSDDGDSAAEDMDGEDEPGLRIPAVNSHGKMKTFKCKQCEFVAVTKLEFWEHSKEHIKPEKMLTCPKCPFVTEYKHHLEYHMRNHFGSKPFQCNQCSYSCVNKSMLNSHLKSHSNIYQYRCSDCSYATKYCHSLKLHLRKYQHTPAMVLNQDGSPNPFPIIDVYGTRRGPKQKTQLKIQEEVHQQSNHSIFQTPYFPYPPLLSHSLLFQDAKEQSLLQQRLLYGEKIPYSYNPPQSNPVPAPILPKPLLSPQKPKAPVPETEISALDLTNATKVESPSPSIAAPSTPTTSMKNRRKGRAYKLERCSAVNECQEEEDICDDDTLLLARTPSPPASPSPKLNSIDIIEVTPDIKTPTPGYDCQYCDIVFKDIIMYTMHMGYHGYKDPFTCNMCGVRSADKVSFFIHIARTQHS